MRRWRRVRPFMDIAASMFWLWLFFKLFITDIDRKLLDFGGVDAGWLVEYRAFFFVGLIAVITLVATRNRVLLGIAYVALFPLVVLLWKIPKTLIKTRSWITFFAVANVVSGLISSFRYAVLAGAIGLFATLFILASDNGTLLAISALSLMAILGVSYFRTIRFAVRPSRFLEIQEKAIERAVDSEKLGELVALNEELKSDEVERFNAQQQDQFVQSLTNGVLANRVLGFWAFELDEYRQSPFSLVFNLAGYIWLLVETTFVLSLVNYAMYKGDQGAFTFVNAPSLITFVRYVLASFGGGEIAAIQAHSDLARAISIASTLIGVVFLLGFGITLFLSIRKGRQDQAIRSAIRRIQAQGQVLEERLRAEYEVSLSEAIERLVELRAALAGIITYLSSRIPSDFEERMGPKT